MPRATELSDKAPTHRPSCDTLYLGLKNNTLCTGLKDNTLCKGLKNIALCMGLKDNATYHRAQKIMPPTTGLNANHPCHTLNGNALCSRAH
mmetsp:Transcript_30378/g.54578  ORF Transcript_30378/g.54578 Transcript_30378/m.54578 type:complete len:91 (-) Transcript_30378:413-685(-)